MDMRKTDSRSRPVEVRDFAVIIPNRYEDVIQPLISQIDGAKDKEIYTLKEFAGECGDIEDPSMKELQGFRIARDEIRDCLLKGLKKYRF